MEGVGNYLTEFRLTNAHTTTKQSSEPVQDRWKPPPSGYVTVNVDVVVVPNSNRMGTGAAARDHAGRVVWSRVWALRRRFRPQLA